MMGFVLYIYQLVLRKDVRKWKREWGQKSVLSKVRNENKPLIVTLFSLKTL